MSDQIGNPVEEQTIYDKLQDIIKGNIDTSNGKIEEALVETIATPEIKRRIDIAHKGFVKLQQMNSQFKKINYPDNELFDAEMKPMKAFTKQRKTELEKLKKEIGELSESFENALTKNTKETYDKLEQKTKQVGGGKSEGGESSE